MEATPPTAATTHEFGPAENEIIGDAGRWIGYGAWIVILAGVLEIVGGFISTEDRFDGLIMGAVYVLVGLWFRGASKAMKAVVTTTGSDVQHLMTALDKLSAAFRVMVLLVAIGIGLALVVGTLIGVGAAIGD